MENIETILLALGSSMDKVFKCTCMLSDMADWSGMSEEYIRFFEQDRKPSRSAFAGSGLALGARVEIECWSIR
jgi:enamine deaminase RidA (YjgF/YER057c/UK114 family)